MNVYSVDEFPPCALWNYALEIYGKKKVSDACLSLQDRHKIDVNLLLFYLWSAACGWSALAPDEHIQALDISSNWQLPIVGPLRHVRNILKNSNSPVDKKFKQELRKTVLESELYAERLELQMLGKLIKRPKGNSGNGQACASCAAENLKVYLAEKADGLTSNDISDILVLWQAAFPGAKDSLLIERLSAG